MKVLIAYTNGNSTGGSEVFHYELIRGLCNYKDLDITVATVTEPNLGFHLWKDINKLGIKIKPINYILSNEEQFDLMIISQPYPNTLLCDYFPNTPKISIIHSEIRSEDPIFHPSIIKYIGIRQPIVDMLINEYKIESSKVSLIYNPIDQTRFNPFNAKKYDKITGIFVGEVLDNIRFKSVNHLVQQCIERDWDLYIMSESRHNFNHPNIKYLDKRWDTENVVKNMDFTAGILLGRTTLEGLCCDVSGYIYQIDKNGEILGIESNVSYNIKEICDSKYVCKQYYNLIKEYEGK